MSTLPLAAVKARRSAVVDTVQGTHERMGITRDGRPAAVLVSVDDLAALEETQPWQLGVASAAARAPSAWLPASADAAAVEFITGPLLVRPRRVGHQLRHDLAGTWSARRGAYRVLCELDDDARLVPVLLVEHRSTVCRSRRGGCVACC